MAMQDTSKDDWESELADFTFRVMDAEASSHFEQQLLECREHVTLAQEYSEVAAWLALSTTPAEPPQGHKSRLMWRISSMPQTDDMDESMLADYTLTATRPLVSERQTRDQVREPLRAPV